MEDIVENAFIEAFEMQQKTQTKQKPLDLLVVVGPRESTRDEKAHTDVATSTGIME